MKAFVEEICEHAGIIRVGLETDQYGKPFEIAVAYTVEIEPTGNRIARIKGLGSPVSALSVNRIRAAMVDVLSERGFQVRWFRIARGTEGACETEAEELARPPVLPWRPIHRPHAE